MTNNTMTPAQQDRFDRRREEFETFVFAGYSAEQLMTRFRLDADLYAAWMEAAGIEEGFYITVDLTDGFAINGCKLVAGSNTIELSKEELALDPEVSLKGASTVVLRMTAPYSFVYEIFSIDGSRVDQVEDEVAGLVVTFTSVEELSFGENAFEFSTPSSYHQVTLDESSAALALKLKEDFAAEGKPFAWNTLRGFVELKHSYDDVFTIVDHRRIFEPFEAIDSITGEHWVNNVGVEYDDDFVAIPSDLLVETDDGVSVASPTGNERAGFSRIVVFHKDNGVERLPLVDGVWVDEHSDNIDRNDYRVYWAPRSGWNDEELELFRSWAGNHEAFSYAFSD